MKRSFNGQVATESTAQRILDGAIRVLGRDGFSGLSARSVAAEAGTNLALLNYYFGSKDQLLLAIFDHLDAQRITRQRTMYDSADLPLSAKWRAAVRFYREDLVDGYVRILQELTAAGYSNPLIAERVRQRLNNWRSLLEEVAAQHLPRLGVSLSPTLVAAALTSYWLGMESEHLSGASEAEGHYFTLLDAIGDWIEQQELKRGDSYASQAT